MNTKHLLKDILHEVISRSIEGVEYIPLVYVFEPELKPTYEGVLEKAKAILNDCGIDISYELKHKDDGRKAYDIKIKTNKEGE